MGKILFEANSLFLSFEEHLPDSCNFRPISVPVIFTNEVYFFLKVY